MKIRANLFNKNKKQTPLSIYFQSIKIKNLDRNMSLFKLKKFNYDQTRNINGGMKTYCIIMKK